MLNTPYKPVYAFEQVGTYGAFGIRIEVTGSNLPDLSHESIHNAAYDAAHAIKKEVMALSIANDPKSREAAERERSQIIGLFQEPIYVEEIPNGYCSDYCCRHLPWFVVTTRVGRIKIGWRKRVIEIDWKETPHTKDSGSLFDAEDVTKYKKLIHAWSLEKAKEYISAILSSVN